MTAQQEVNEAAKEFERLKGKGFFAPRWLLDLEDEIEFEFTVTIRPKRVKKQEPIAPK